ncbi:DUF3445 domain-containing protein [Parahaliea maris]|uniref:DUF3445 domain-containing protein n=1 Tax=Parahaliea maris TaxID=2716870 RepID=A0A5C9A238_9GAMM|nr:DUF3445 domain-containing protein [Parahaliea maris]TXS94129.1 DUF3445 domain-containing protein [Parahaliea maris]
MLFPPMKFDHRRPRHLPHLDHTDILLMGLSPLGSNGWIEPDGEAGRYHLNKLAQRRRYGDRVYNALPESLPAQRELAECLLPYLLREHGDCYRREGARLYCLPGGFRAPVTSAEPLWTASLWVADDLVIMEPRGDTHCLTAASLCAASHWRLEDKIGGTLGDIHAVIPGFNATLLPRVERFFRHLRVEHPVVRFNWSLQRGGRLNQRNDDAAQAADAELYYRVERQSLRRLPDTGAVIFTIRVYLHPLLQLQAMGPALPKLFQAIESNPLVLQQYKGFDRLEGALQPYRALARGAAQ